MAICGFSDTFWVFFLISMVVCLSVSRFSERLIEK